MHRSEHDDRTLLDKVLGREQDVPAPRDRDDRGDRRADLAHEDLGAGDVPGDGLATHERRLDPDRPADRLDPDGSDPDRLDPDRLDPDPRSTGSRGPDTTRRADRLDPDLPGQDPAGTRGADALHDEGSGRAGSTGHADVRGADMRTVDLRSDGAAPDDTRHDSAAHDSAAHDSAAHDSAAHDSALSDHALGDRADGRTTQDGPGRDPSRPDHDPTLTDPDLHDRNGTRADGRTDARGDTADRGPRARSLGGPADGAAGGTDEHPALIPQDRSADYMRRWESLKAGFVDEPRGAVRDANGLVGEVLDELEELFRRQRSELEIDLRDEQASTEDLRLALGRYRSFFDRLLTF
ncbi:hypothetical protein GCM10009836_08770 [Pseudonocardia ailaonensis]|uniref:Uncharacterized protein n=1 Tax=Pseudonocardia ailaonensis TaxID=367279 RepID=A0ABN2MPH8_9PSEU